MKIAKNVIEVSSLIQIELKEQHSSTLETFIYTNEHVKA